LRSPAADIADAGAEVPVLAKVPVLALKYRSAAEVPRERWQYLRCR
jgi:hypothetical protein